MMGDTPGGRRTTGVLPLTTMVIYLLTHLSSWWIEKILDPVLSTFSIKIKGGKLQGDITMKSMFLGKVFRYSIAWSVWLVFLIPTMAESSYYSSILKKYGVI